MFQNNFKYLAIITFFILALNLSFFHYQDALAQTDQTGIKLEAATASVNQAFISISAAEKAGANITSLLKQLNNANDLLAQAENAYRTGDNNATASDASAVIPITQQVTVEAQTAKQNALTSAQNSFWSSAVITLVVAVVFVSVLFLTWRWFRRNYIRHMSELKPEVRNQ
jgi:predicted PurR-regulated permease PerM